MDHVVDGAPPPRAPGEIPVIDASGATAPPVPAKASAKGRDRTLFVYQQIAPHTSRVVTAAQARLDGPDRSGRIVLNLNDFTSHTFADAHPMPNANGATRADPLKCANCTDMLRDSPPITMKVRDMSQLMMVDQLLPFTARTSNTAEQTIFEQLFMPDYHDKDARPAQMRLLAERVSRSLLSFLAPLMALLGVALTTRMTNWLALPFSCLALMTVNLLCEWVITRVAPISVAGALLPPLLLYAGIAYGVFTAIVWRHSEFVRPQLARS